MLGIFDQYTAIEWVRNNISAFGGNPNNITLMGQSAGAMSIQTLICSDMLKGKVKGAVMLSGGGKRGAILPISKPNVAYWNKLVKASGAQSFAEFKNLDARPFGRRGKQNFRSEKHSAQNPLSTENSSKTNATIPISRSCWERSKRTCFRPC